MPNKEREDNEIEEGLRKESCKFVGLCYNFDQERVEVPEVVDVEIDRKKKESNGLEKFYNIFERNEEVENEFV